MNEPRPNQLSGVPTPTPNRLSGMTPPTPSGRPDGESSGRRRTLGRWLRRVLGLVIVLGAIGRVVSGTGGDGGDAEPTGSPTGGAVAGGAGGVAPGTCFNVPTTDLQDTTKEIDPYSWPSRPCQEPHAGEFLFVGDFGAETGADYPTETQFNAYFDDNCAPAFQTFTGYRLDFAYDVAVQWVVPGENAWRMGDRYVICYLVPIDGQPVSSSYRALSASPSP